MTESLETSEAEAVPLSAEQMAQNLAAVEAFAAQASIGHLGRLVDELRAVNSECVEALQAARKLIDLTIPFEGATSRLIDAAIIKAEGIEA